MGHEGTDIMISFTPAPLDYKKISGMLVILTDEMQWSYKVMGSHPAYTAPEGKTKVTSYHSQEVTRKVKNVHARQRRNYMREQMIAAQEAAKKAYVKKAQKQKK